MYKPLIYLFLFGHIITLLDVYAENKKIITTDSDTIKWKKVKEDNKSNGLNKIIWKSYNNDESYFKEKNLEGSTDIESLNIKLNNNIENYLEEINLEGSTDIEPLNIKLNNNIENYLEEINLEGLPESQYQNIKLNNIENKKRSPNTQIDSFIPLNNYLKQGDLNTTLQWKSAFSGGAGGGTGHQNISARFDYGLSSDSLLTLYFSESDDPLFNSINGEIIQNTWSVFALGHKKKLLQSDDLKDTLSLASSIEYWIITSGKDGPNYSKSMFNGVDNTLGFEKYTELIYSLSLPYTRKINNKINLVVVPGAIFLPDTLGNKNLGKTNFYGNNFYLGSGLEFKILKDFNLMGSYTYLFGPGSNYFNENLKFSNKSIYSYGFNWDVNPIIGIEGKITNGYGATPATGLLTIPSSDEALYYFGASYKPYQKDTKLTPLQKESQSLLHGGLTVENALIPMRGQSQLSLNYDSAGSLLSEYKYSLSNIFQLQLISLGSSKGINYQSKNNSNIRSTYLNKYNFNYRLGGKLLFLSPQKNDQIWLASRVSIGRDLHSRQGYFFSDLTSTFKLNKNIALNISPKYLFSGVDNLGALGISSYFNLSKVLIFIAETNIGLNHNAENNSTFSFRYLNNPRRAIDFYLSNAVGLEDLDQLLKSDNYKYGMKISFIF